MRDKRSFELSGRRDRKRSGRAKAATIQRKSERRTKWQAQGRDVR